MALQPVDICWIAHTSGVSVLDDLATLREFAQQTSYRLELALVGKSEASILSSFPENVHVTHIRESGLGWDLTKPSKPLSDGQAGEFLEILGAWQGAKTLREEGVLLKQLGLLLMNCGPEFRLSALWRRPEIIEAMVKFHAERKLGVSVTDSILVTNEFIEALIRSMRVVEALPKARVYHGLRGVFCGFIAAMAAESHGAECIYSANIDASEAVEPFWLRVLPHHWFGSLSHSRIYQMAGKHALRLAEEVVGEMADRTLIPFQLGDGGDLQVRVVAPGIANPTLVGNERRAPVDGLAVAWLVKTADAEHLNRVSDVIHALADETPEITFEVMETSPERRSWDFDYEEWLGAQSTQVRNQLKGLYTYRRESLENVDCLVSLPETSQADGGEEDVLWATLQALCDGVPVVSHRPFDALMCGAHDVCGIVLEDAQAQTVAGSLMSLVRDEDRRATLGLTAGEAARRHFSRSRAVEEHGAVYASLLETPRVRARGAVSR